jgi:hypothetical protein
VRTPGAWRRMPGGYASRSPLQTAAVRIRGSALAPAPIVAIDDAIFHYKEYLFGLIDVRGRSARRDSFRPAGLPQPKIL